MILRWGLYLALLAPCATPALAGSIIDVSSEGSALVHSGDTLVFHVLTSSFAANAAAFGLPLNPQEVSFALTSDPLSIPGNFSATLQSEDGNVSVAFDSLISGTGYFQGSTYQGPTATLQGYLHLSTGVSNVLFTAPSVIIALQNQGPDVTVGFSSFLLRQDLFASLSGGPLTVGAVTTSVELSTPDAMFQLLDFVMPDVRVPDSAVPEPNSAGLFVGGGLLLCAVSALLARLSGFRA